MDNIININEYQNLKILNNKICIIFPFIIFLLIIIISTNFKFENGYENKMIVNDDYASTLIKVDDLKYFYDNKNILIDNKIYEFEIIDIGNPKIFDNEYYQELNLKIYHFNKIKNTVLTYKIESTSQSIFKIVYNIFLRRK